MNKVIRIPGLIAFVVIIGVMAASVYFLANPLIKSLIENKGSALVGAKVDVGAVAMSLAPAGITISRLDVADADEPMTNVVSIKSINLHFDVLKALMGQMIIHDMSVNGMQFATARTTSGAIAKTEKPKPKTTTQPSFISEQMKALSGTLPDSKELLARESLATDKSYTVLQQSLEEKQDTWRTLEQQIPNNEKIAQYQTRVKALQNSKIKTLDDFTRVKRELEQLQKDIKADKETLQQAKDFVASANKELTSQLKALKDAPQQDKDALLKKYTLDESGLVNMSGLLFGAQAQEYLATALSWYEKIAPYLASDTESEAEKIKRERLEGRFVHFTEKNPYPDFLIENMAASALFPLGEVSATAKEITHQQAVRNRATTLHVMSEVLRNVKQLDVAAIFDYRVKNQGVSFADFTLKDAVVQDFVISQSTEFPLQLAHAQSQVTGQIRLNQSTLSGHLHSDFEQAQFVVAEAQGFIAIIANAFKDIQRFDLDASIGGSLKKPDIHISSNIDKQLKASFEKQLREQVAQFKQQLEQQLNERVNAYLAKANLPEFVNQEGDLQQKLANVDELLKAKLDDYAEQQKNEAKQKAEDKAKQELLKKLKF